METQHEINETTFAEFEKNHFKDEGLVILGAGGDINEWINGIHNMLVQEGITSGEIEDNFASFHKMTTTGGRTDVAMVFSENTKLTIGKLAMFRIRFGDLSWISDYFVNYKKQHVTV